MEPKSLIAKLKTFHSDLAHIFYLQPLLSFYYKKATYVPAQQEKVVADIMSRLIWGCVGLIW